MKYSSAIMVAAIMTSNETLPNLSCVQLWVSWCNRSGRLIVLILFVKDSAAS